MDKETSVRLTNGIIVVNFSSPHDFNFDDGSVLPACSAERARALSLVAREIEHPSTSWVDIELSFDLTADMRDELLRLFLANEKQKQVVVLVPLPVMQAMKAEFRWDAKRVRETPFRCVRSADRITKVIRHDRFCI